MQKIFDVTNPFWRLMSLLSDWMLLTIIWFICSLPIITLVPATIALFSVAGRLHEDSHLNVVKTFIPSFIKYLKNSFLPGIFILILGIILSVDIWYFHNVDAKIATFLLFAFIIITAIFIILLLYMLPIKALFDWDWSFLIIKSFLLAFTNLQWSLFLLTSNGLIIFVTIFIAPYISFFSIGGLAWLNTKVIVGLMEKDNLIKYLKQL